jgi:hypothetical protein
MSSGFCILLGLPPFLSGRSGKSLNHEEDFFFGLETDFLVNNSSQLFIRKAVLKLLRNPPFK